MQEEIISLKTAKLAKEKGWKFPYTIEYLEEIEGTNRYFGSLPSQSLLQKWLREKHNIYIILLPGVNNDWGYDIIDNPIHHTQSNRFELDDTQGTYEQALEVALQEGLKLIK